MITALEIENFKGIAHRQRIELAPITLLFGPNNAGKSTILQALLYLHELLTHGSADVGRTELGGESVDLGGFERLVHGHDRKQAITLRAEFETSGSLQRFGRLDDELAFPDLDDNTEGAWIELTVRERTAPGHQGPILDRVLVGLNEERGALVSIETGPNLREGEWLSACINMAHPLLAELDVGTLGVNRYADVADVAAAWAVVAMAEVISGDTDASDAGETRATKDAEPAVGSDFGEQQHLLIVPVVRSRLSALPPLSEALTLVGGETEPARRDRSGGPIEPGQSAIEVRTFLEMVVLGTAAQLAATLRSMLYVGPLRSVPPQGMLHGRLAAQRSWADGLAAWDALHHAHTLARTNAWFAHLGVELRAELRDVLEWDAHPGLQRNVEKIVYAAAERHELPDWDDEDAWYGEGMVYPFDLQQIRELAEALAALQDAERGHVLRLRRTEDGTRLNPAEVGVGISQLVPVIVASIMGQRGASLTHHERAPSMVMIEQPELHVHPAVQVGLGDLFIAACKSRHLLVETHSEHLVLRLLRRIRETTERDNAEVPGPTIDRGGQLALFPPDPFSPDQLSVIYVESTPKGVRIHHLGVDETGEFTSAWPKGFFEERAEELF